MRVDTQIANDWQQEKRFPPPSAFAAQANVNSTEIYERAAADFEGYWEGWAKQLEWSSPWTKVLEWSPPFAKWFVGGKLNVSVNCLGRHLADRARQPRDWGHLS